MKQYVVDAFTREVFRGNPAAVCVMKDWLPDEMMQKIAIENQLSETAFAVKQGDMYGLRWFTPGGEIDLCGHATLGTAYVILRFYEPQAETVSFTTMSGVLTVTKKDGRYEMAFPSYELKEVPVTDAMEEAIGARPLAAYMARDLLCVMDSEDFVRNASPDLSKVAGCRDCCCTSRRRERHTTVYPGRLRPSWRCRRTRYAAPATAISFHTGRRCSASRSSSAGRPRPGAAPCTAAWKKIR